MFFQNPTYIHDLTDLLSKKDFRNAAAVIIKNQDIRQAVLDELVFETKENLNKLCKHESLSALRGQNKDLLENFSIKSVTEEMRQKLAILWDFLMGIVSDPKQDRNKFKKRGALLPQCVSTSAGLVHVYSRDMNIFQCMNNLIMFKGGCKKAAFSRLNATGSCLSYRATLDMADRLASGWDKQLLKLISEVEMSVQIEETMQQQIETLDETIDLMCESPVCETLIMEQEQMRSSLQEHRKTMHPGFYFVGDNVDMRTQVRQMTIKNQAKDFHIYNLCAYMNRVSGNHLDNTTPKRDVSSVMHSELIPGELLHQKLIEEFSFLIAQEWCTRIVWLRPFKTALPAYIQHPYMKEMQQKTKRVREF